MDVTYTEGPLAVSIPETNQEVKRGEVVTVSDTLGKQLVAQGWQEVNTKTTIKSQKETQ
jgi:hypothetical protein